MTWLNAWNGLSPCKVRYKAQQSDAAPGDKVRYLAKDRVTQMIERCEDLSK